MEQTPLTAQKRTTLGRKVKTLRKEGLIPAHVFGHKLETIHVQVKTSDFSKVFEKTGETGIIDLAVDGQKHPVLVRNVQTHPVTDDPLHIDFYQVNLSEKVKVNVPLEITGEAPAEQKKIGLLLTPISELEIEALPTDIPESIEVDVAKLENIGDEIRVKDLPIDRTKIEVQTDEELVVVSIGELVTKGQAELEAQIEAEQAEAAVAEVPAEGAPAEGEEVKAEGEEVAAESAQAPADGAEKAEANPPTGGEKPQEEKKPQ
ncbi:50S ribosomal protein L25 [Candidatus Curtissbacteria bacterium]|nr:50S ribosomal protein L25 [Candidatus Curtissbacteria bacterium]